MLHEDRRDIVIQIPIPNGRRAEDAGDHSHTPLELVKDPGTVHEILARRTIRLERKTDRRRQVLHR